MPPNGYDRWNAVNKNKYLRFIMEKIAIQSRATAEAQDAELSKMSLPRGCFLAPPQLGKYDC